MSWRNKKNDAAALPLPQPQTIHNHPQPYTGLAFVVGGFVLALFPAAWWGLCFIFDKLGSRNPEYSAATLVAIVICGAVLWWPVTWLAGNVSATNHAHKIEIMQAMNEHAQAMARLQLQASTTGAIGARALESDYVMARACLAVLAKAYNVNRPYTANESRPWVRDNAWRLISASGIQGIKWGDCNGVKGWLEENGFVVGNQLNRVKYPHFEDARRAVDLIAAPPIKINQPTPYYSEKVSIIK